jgi:hypothetical protein
MTNERGLAWSEIHELLPPGWRVPTGPQCDPRTGDSQGAGVAPKRGGRRGRPPDYVVGGGTDEARALVDLVLKLRARHKAGKLGSVADLLDAAVEATRPTGPVRVVGHSIVP